MIQKIYFTAIVLILLGYFISLAIIIIRRGHEKGKVEAKDRFKCLVCGKKVVPVRRNNELICPHCNAVIKRLEKEGEEKS